MNYSDSERIAAVLEDLGYQKTDNVKKADIVFFNTCSVRQKAEDRVFGMLKNVGELKKKTPRLIIGITGCMTRLSSTKFSEPKDYLFRRVKTLDLVLKIEDLTKLKTLLDEIRSNARHQMSNVKCLPHCGTHVKDYFHIIPKYSSKSQAFIPIMTGCDNFCSYCIVPYSRGREKSRPIADIVKEAKELVKNGCLEITLLGQNVNSYGLSALDQKSGFFKKTEKPPFVELLEKINQLKGLKRILFTSSHPKDMSDELIHACAALDKMCPYIHLPVQSGDNEILKKMNRNYTREHYLELIKKIRQNIPNCAISTDIIVGFPGETDEQFENTYKLFQEVEWDMAYMGRYSPREGTVSAKLYPDNISPQEKARRWEKINRILKKSSFKKNKFYQGKTVDVLVETCKNSQCSGKTDTMKIVLFKGKKDLIGKLVPVKIKEAKEWVLEGKRVNS